MQSRSILAKLLCPFPSADAWTTHKATLVIALPSSHFLRALSDNGEQGCLLKWIT